MSSLYIEILFADSFRVFFLQYSVVAYLNIMNVFLFDISIAIISVYVYDIVSKHALPYKDIRQIVHLNMSLAPTVEVGSHLSGN